MPPYALSPPSTNPQHTSALHQRNSSLDDGSGYADFSGHSHLSGGGRPGPQLQQLGGGGRVTGSFGPQTAQQPSSSSHAGGGGGSFRSGGGEAARPAPPQGGSGGGEQRLVDELCAPGGMRAAPDPQDLRLFVESASSMDGLRVGELLIEKMVGGSS